MSAWLTRNIKSHGVSYPARDENKVIRKSTLIECYTARDNALWIMVGMVAMVGMTRLIIISPETESGEINSQSIHLAQ